MPQFNDLPNEVVLQINQYLDLSTSRHLNCICRHVHEVTLGALFKHTRLRLSCLKCCDGLLSAVRNVPEIQRSVCSLHICDDLERLELRRAIKALDAPESVFYTTEDRTYAQAIWSTLRLLPALKSLCIIAPSGTLPLDCGVEPHTLSRLETLQLTYCEWHEKELAGILSCMPMLKELRIDFLRLLAGHDTPSNNEEILPPRGPITSDGFHDKTEHQIIDCITIAEVLHRVHLTLETLIISIMSNHIIKRYPPRPDPDSVRLYEPYIKDSLGSFNDFPRLRYLEVPIALLEEASDSRDFESRKQKLARLLPPNVEELVLRDDLSCFRRWSRIRRKLSPWRYWLMWSTRSAFAPRWRYCGIRTRLGYSRLGSPEARGLAEDPSKYSENDERAWPGLRWCKTGSNINKAPQKLSQIRYELATRGVEFVVLRGEKDLID